jgi:hypothetical protein
MVHSTQIVHLSCAEINTVSKRTKASLHLTHIHLGVPSGQAKMISKHVRHKWGTYLALRLALSSKRPKRASIWPTSPRSSIVCPRWFLSLMHVRHKWGTYLVSRLALYQKRPKWASIWPRSPRSSIVCPKRFLSLWYVSPNPCTYYVEINTISKWTKTSFHLTHVT